MTAFDLRYLTPAELNAKEIAASVHALGRDVAVRRGFASQPVPPHQLVFVLSYLRRSCAMATIIPLLRDQVFDQHDINAMSMALDDIFRELKLPDGDHPARRDIAERVIDLARTGEHNASALRDRILKEAGFGHRLA